ncbi:MAG: 50S ribosomal protein L18 [Patescibacteria group bacterium]
MNKKLNRIKRKIRVRGKIRGTENMPRLSVFRSNKYMYAQVVNDDKGQTIVAISEKQLEKKEALNKTDKSKELGMLIAKKAIAKKVKKVVFDKSGYAYHGRVKAIAEGAREGGLQF